MFHYRKTMKCGNGGRTLVHSSKKLGELLSDRLKRKLESGQRIVTGFLDENHPLKGENFVRSWQDRFGTTDKAEAIDKCRAQKTHFDDCYFEEDDGILMTEVTVPLSKGEYHFYPRIQYNDPSIINGKREFLFGDGTAFTPQDIQELLTAYWATRRGWYPSPGDLLLIDNLKYAHSREPYIETGEIRDTSVTMSGSFTNE
jgi:hypothetical protein